MKIQLPKYKPLDYYVYIHRKLTTGEIFYIGKGKNDRYKCLQNRSKFWKNIASKHGLLIEIYQDGLQEWYAFELEKELIDLYGRRDSLSGNLVNLKDGGDFGRNYKHSTEWRSRMSKIMSELQRDKTVHNFINDLTGEIFIGTRFDFRTNYNINPNSLFGVNKFNYIKNWRLTSTKPIKSRSISRILIHIERYKFIHETGEIFIGTRKEFEGKYNINLNRLFMLKPRKSLYGWKIEKV